MARGLTSSIKTELATGVIDPVLLVEIDFGTPIYLTNAPFDNLYYKRTFKKYYWY